jgi:hypothetical protein
MQPLFHRVLSRHLSTPEVNETTCSGHAGSVSWGTRRETLSLFWL